MKSERQIEMDELLRVEFNKEHGFKPLGLRVWIELTLILLVIHMLIGVIIGNLAMTLGFIAHEDIALVTKITAFVSLLSTPIIKWIGWSLVYESRFEKWQKNNKKIQCTCATIKEALIESLKNFVLMLKISGLSFVVCYVMTWIINFFHRVGNQSSLVILDNKTLLLFATTFTLEITLVIPVILFMINLADIRASKYNK